MDPTLSSPLPCYCPLTSTVAEQAKAAELAKAEAEDALIDAQAAAEADAATAQAAQEAQEATHLRGLRVQLEADAAALEERALRAEGEKAAAQAEAGALREAAAAAQAADAAALKETAAAAAAALGAVQAEAAGAKLAEQAARGEGKDAKERCATLISSNSKLQESVAELGAQLSEGRTRLSGLIKENAALQVPACTVHGCSVCSCLLSLPCLCAVTPAVCPAVYLQRAYRRERGAAGGADSRRRRRRRRRRSDFDGLDALCCVRLVCALRAVESSMHHTLARESWVEIGRGDVPGLLDFERHEDVSVRPGGSSSVCAEHVALRMRSSQRHHRVDFRDRARRFQQGAVDGDGALEKRHVAHPDAVRYADRTRRHEREDDVKLRRDRLVVGGPVASVHRGAVVVCAPERVL